MKYCHLTFAAASVLLAAACNGNANDAAEERLEDEAEASAAAAGPTEAALGLSEIQLLEADLMDSAGTDLGDVARVMRGSDGAVDRLLIEIEDSNPDRFVYIPIDGLSPVKHGDDTDLSTTMSKSELEALPDADIGTS